jgi:hypothetical protein
MQPHWEDLERLINALVVYKLEGCTLHLWACQIVAFAEYRLLKDQVLMLWKSIRCQDFSFCGHCG